MTNFSYLFVAMTLAFTPLYTSACPTKPKILRFTDDSPFMAPAGDIKMYTSGQNITIRVPGGTSFSYDEKLGWVIKGTDKETGKKIFASANSGTYKGQKVIKLDGVVDLYNNDETIQLGSVELPKTKGGPLTFINSRGDRIVLKYHLKSDEILKVKKQARRKTLPAHATADDIVNMFTQKTPTRSLKPNQPAPSTSNKEDNYFAYTSIESYYAHDSDKPFNTSRLYQYDGMLMRSAIKSKPTISGYGDIVNLYKHDGYKLTTACGDKGLKLATSYMDKKSSGYQPTLGYTQTGGGSR